MKNKISLQEIEKLKSFDSPTISNAIEEFGVRDNTVGYASVELKCLTPYKEPMVGFAITVTVDTVTPGKRDLTKLRDFYDMLGDEKRPIVVAEQFMGPDRSRSMCLGDLFSVSIHKLGAVGAITDCAVRDIDGIKEKSPGLYIFSPGLVVSHGNVVWHEINTTVSICGLTIKPNDLLHGDINGVTSIPIDLIDIKELITAAEGVVKREKEIFDYMLSDSVSIEELKDKIAPRE